MATQTQPLTRDQLAALPDSYFKAVDAKDVDAILSHFADDAMLTVQTDHAVFSGRRRSAGCSPTSARLGVDLPRDQEHRRRAGLGKVATEQSYIGELNDGTKNDMHNCNFFDVDADGKFTRVIIWMAGTNPLK